MCMKKFTLFLLATLMATVTFAQVPQHLGKRITAADAPQKVQLKPGMKALNTESQRMVMLNAASKSHAKMIMAYAAKSFALQNKLGNNAQNLQFQNSLKAQKMDAQQLKITRKSGKKASKAPRKAEGQTPVAAPADLETETYKCTAVSYVDFGNVSYDVQVGFDGNDVYVQGLLRALPEGWVKGVKGNGVVTFAKGQYLGDAEVNDYYTGESLGMFPATMMYQDGMTGQDTDLVLTINEETGVLDDLAQGALYFDDGNDGMLDVLLGTRLTPMSALGDISYELVTPPASAETFGVDISAHSFALEKQISNTGMMAIDGNDIYVMGLCPDVAAWVKGTLGADGTVTFAKGQYLGMYRDMIDMWFMGINPQDPSSTLIDVKAAWDATERTLTFDDNTWVVENADAVSLYFADVLYDIFVEPMSDDRALVIPPADLETRTHKAKVASIGTIMGMYTYGNSTYNVNIGFDGDDVYMQGLLYYAPTAWIKGTRNADGSLTFEKNQYLGTVEGYDVYVVPCSDEDEDNPAEIYDTFTFTYDAAKDTYYYIEQNTNLSFSVAPNTTDAVDIIFNVVLSGPDAPAEEEINTDVIWDQPEGDLKVYTRGGGAYYSFWGYIIDTTQGGTSIKIVTNGNDVYMENPISQGQVEGGTWVKGTLEGNKIHMPLKQCVIYSEEEGYGYMTAALKADVQYDEDAEEYYLNYVMTDETEVTFTINEDGTITLDHQSVVDPETGLADWIYGLVYTDDLAWSQLGDYNSVYTPFEGEYATIPEGAATEQWAMMYKDENNYSSAHLCDVAIVGDKMYIAGMSKADPEAAMVGTIADGKVTFASDQYIGLSTGYVSYGVFANVTTEQVWDDWYEEYYDMESFEYLPEYSFTYDAENKMLTSADDVAFVVNAGKGEEEILYITLAKAPKFNFFEEVVATPADPEFLDYSNYFDDYGYDMLSCNVKLEDVNGKYMNQDKVFYTIYVKIDGEAEQFVFYADEYAGFAELGIEEMTEVPVNFTVLDDYGYEDISASGSGICLYQSGFDDFGIQTIYYGGGERRTSNIVWWSDVEAGIHDVTLNSDSKTIYDLQGRQLQKMQKGVNIVNVNGKNVKVLVK